MSQPNFLTVEYETGSSLIIEGFGPNSIAGVVKDILEGYYPGPNNPPVKSITITKE